MRKPERERGMNVEEECRGRKITRHFTSTMREEYFDPPEV
jgi:hypothetical protein